MTLHERNTDALRKAHEAVSKQIFRVGLVRLIVLVILGLAFGRAFESVSTEEVREKKQALNEAIARAHIVRYNDCGPEFLGYFCFKGEQTEEVIHIVADLKGVYKRAFVLEPQVIGTNIEVDLRVWIFAVPFLLIGSELYLQILRKKKSLLAAVAAYNLATEKDEKNLLDNLLFQEGAQSQTYFLRYPQALLDYSSLILIAAIAAYVIYMGKEFWAYSNTHMVLGQALISVTVYAVGFFCHVANRFETQVEALLRIQPKKNRVTVIWRKLGKIIGSLTVRLNPKRSVVMGSVLTLVSLALLFTVDSCAGTTARGYQIALGNVEITGPVFELGSTLDSPMRYLYTSGIVLAIVSIFLLCIPAISRKVFGNRLMVSGLYRLCGTILLYVICLLSASWLQWALLSGVFWVIGVFLWWWFRFSAKSAAGRWPGIRSVLLILYIPLLIAVVDYFLETRPISGWLAFLLGMAAMTIGYMRFTVGSESSSQMGTAAPVDQRRMAQSSSS